MAYSPLDDELPEEEVRQILIEQGLLQAHVPVRARKLKPVDAHPLSMGRVVKELTDDEAFDLMEKHGLIRREWDEASQDWLVWPTEKLERMMPETEELRRILGRRAADRWSKDVVESLRHR